MSKRPTTNPSDLCPSPTDVRPLSAAAPKSPPIYMSSVYKCNSTSEALAMLSGEAEGYVYLRDGHPNADWLADRCAQLHGADRATVVSTGMAALALGMVSQVKAGDHVILSRHHYGRTRLLFEQEGERLGIDCSVVDCTDLDQLNQAMLKNLNKNNNNNASSSALQIA